MKQLPNQDQDHDHEDLLRLSLSTGSPFSPMHPSPFLDQEISNSPSNSPYPTPPSPNSSDTNTFTNRPHKRRTRRRSSNRLLRPGKSVMIPAPYPWATTKRATVHNLRYLQAKGLNTISGRVQCKRCERQYDMEYNLHEKFREVAIFIAKNKKDMHQRAPAVWMNPTLPDCKYCEQNNCMKPILSKKKAINWLFLLLGQMIGCCKLSELKYFCKHTSNHRTGAKDRVLYAAYLELWKQLDPEGSYVG